MLTIVCKCVATSLVRASLRQLTGRRIDERVIDQTCHVIAALALEGDGLPVRDKDGGDDGDERKEGLISAADFGVYLREFGTPASLLILGLVTVASALLSVCVCVCLSVCLCLCLCLCGVVGGRVGLGFSADCLAREAIACARRCAGLAFLVLG